MKFNISSFFELFASIRELLIKREKREKLEPQNLYFRESLLNSELHIILKLRNLEIGEHSNFFNY